MTSGQYETVKPGEIFLTLGKAGSTLAGFADAFATAISFAFQHGVELRFLVDKFTHVRFEPSGFTGNPTSPSRSRSWTTYSAGWHCGILPEEDQPRDPDRSGQRQRARGGAPRR